MENRNCHLTAGARKKRDGGVTTAQNTLATGLVWSQNGQGFNMCLREKSSLICVAAMLASMVGGGCVRRPEPVQEKRTRPNEPGVSITTYEKGPTRYEVLSTNQGDGTRTYKFVPRR